MQVTSDSPLSDEDSIRMAVRKRFIGVSVMSPEGYPDPDAVTQFARAYNPNPNFVALFEAAYFHLTQEGSQ